MRQSWRSALGLASRALLITAQRFLDCHSIYHGFNKPQLSAAPVLLLCGLAVTTLLMAVTMQRHWSALKRGRAHGCPVGFVMASLQLAPVWEMLDKMLASSRARVQPQRPGARQPLLRHESTQTRPPPPGPGAPSLRSDLPKGSPGENAMRGVRKMSMVNLPQAMLSLWVHAGQLAPVGPEAHHRPATDVMLGLAFLAAFLCVAFGIADFVLYIWVHDAFVRENKKLVTLHYCVEILCRVPAVVLFHVSYSRQYSYVPTAVLFLVDVLLTSVILLASRLSAPNTWWGVCRCAAIRSVGRRSLTQFLYSLIVSVQLFVVNVVFFDPGMIFFYVNQAFYIVKYVELAVMLRLIQKAHTSGILIASPTACFNRFWWSELGFALVNAFLVYVYVPFRRAEKDARLTSSVDHGSSVDGDLEAGSGGSPRGDFAGDEGADLLERLEEIFEMLRLLSMCSCGRNRTRLMGIIVAELWLQALRWDGEYDDGAGGIAHMAVIRPHAAGVRIRIPPRALHGGPGAGPGAGAANGAGAAGGAGGAVNGSGGGAPTMRLTVAPATLAREQHILGALDGPRISIPGGEAGTRHGTFDGRCVLWDDGEVWTRWRGDGDAAGSQARAILGLILPQLALALKWDGAPHGEHGGAGAGDAASSAPPGVPATSAPPAAAGAAAYAAPGAAAHAAHEAAGGAGAAAGGPPGLCHWPEVGAARPLLSFLVRYAMMTRQADFISDLYWALHCLSNEEAAHPHYPQHQRLHRAASHVGGYRAARLALLRMLRGEGLEPGPSDATPGLRRQPSESWLRDEIGAAEAAAFLEGARQLLLGQRELWQQKMELLVALGHLGAPACGGCQGVVRPSGSGAWAHRTEDFREALRRWPDLRRRLARLPARADEDTLLLSVPPSGAASPSPSGLGDPAAAAPPLSAPPLSAPGAAAAPPRAALAPAAGAPLAASASDSPPPSWGPTDLVAPDGSAFVSLPIDPGVGFRGIDVEECAVVPSKHAPLLFSCWIGGAAPAAAAPAGPPAPAAPPPSPPAEAAALAPPPARAKYLLKVGDDLRQDQLMLQVMALMGCVWQERLPPTDAKLLQLAKFRVLAVTPQSGYVKFVPDAVSLTDALHESKGDLHAWLDSNRPQDTPLEKVLDTFYGSVAACCVVTYILGIGDRHLENLCITRRGQFFHIDFSFVLGDDPKPCAPQVRLPQQVAQTLLATDRLGACFGLAARAYLALRPFAGLWSSVLQLTAAAGGSGCAKLAREPVAAVAGVRERLRVDQADEDRAASEFLCLVRESSEGLASILMDKVHAAGLFWR